MEIPFITVDVFTDRKFGGNPLAVVPDAAALSGAQMQAIAAEFNLAETTFVLPPRNSRTRRKFASSRRAPNCRSPAIPISAPLLLWRKKARGRGGRYLIQ